VVTGLHGVVNIISQLRHVIDGTVREQEINFYSVLVIALMSLIQTTYVSNFALFEFAPLTAVGTPMVVCYS
jgi:hypothetical protein